MDSFESEVRNYSRSYPAVFSGAKNGHMTTREGDKYIDFLSGCGALNYGHNNDVMKKALMDYISSDGLTLGLDLRSVAREAFIGALRSRLLVPRSLDYRVQFTGPTGANAVEAAVKLARKVTGRTTVIAFTNAFHGCSIGALSLTANSHNRASSVPLLSGVHRALYDGYLGNEIDTSHILRKQLSDPSSGVDQPAAIIVEVVQGEGGLNAANCSWLKNISLIAADFGALLIVDEIQTGCGRLGSFFSFEDAHITPDIVTLGKSISGFGLPLSLILLKPSVDVWLPGEHSGTFRGNNHAFVTAAAAIEHYWSDQAFEMEIRRKAEILRRRLTEFCSDTPFRPKGRGLMQGIDLVDHSLAQDVRKELYRRKIIVELCGPRDEVLKLMPPLTIDERELTETTDRIIDVILSLSRKTNQTAKSPPVAGRKPAV